MKIAIECRVNRFQMADINFENQTLPFQILTGKCRCRPGVKGLQCDQCPPHWHLAGHGCVPGPSHSCQRLKCQYGAVCRQMGTRVECSCQLNCSVHNQSATSPVCASDGTQHPSLCHFREHMCRLQKRIHIVKNCPNT